MNKNAKIITRTIGQHAAKLRGQLAPPKLDTFTVEDEDRDFIWSSEHGRYRNNGDSRAALPRALADAAAVLSRDLKTLASVAKAFNEKATKAYQAEKAVYDKKIAKVDKWAFETEIELLLSDELGLAKALTSLPTLDEILR